MLGYTKEDLDNMILYVGFAHDASNSETSKKELSMTHSFLQGLWAEGYFD